MTLSYCWLLVVAILLFLQAPSNSFKFLSNILHKTRFYSVDTSVLVSHTNQRAQKISLASHYSQYSRQSRQSPSLQSQQQSNGSSLTYDGILQVIRAFRAGQVSSPRSDGIGAQSRPFLSSNAALATIGTTTTSSGQVTLTSNSTNVFRYLLKSSIKAKFIDHVLAITSILLEYECMSPHDFLDVLGLICEQRSHAEGLALLDEAVSYNIDMNSHLFSPLLKSSGNAQNARKVLQRMEFFGFSPNVISFTTAIKSCEGAGDWIGALELFSLMKSVGVAPNERTYACAISAASRGLAADVALNMLNEMTLNDFPPNMICYGSALTACARCRMWPEVDVLLTQMVKNHMMLNQSVLSSVINVCRHSSSRYPVVAAGEGASASRSVATLTSSLSSDIGYSEGTKESDIESNTEAEEEIDGESEGENVATESLPTVPSADVQWERAVYLLTRWSEHIQGKNESLYTLVMGICASVNRHAEVTDIFFKMVQDGIPGSRNSCRFALRACVDGNLPERAVQVVRQANPTGVVKSFMLTETLAMCERNGRCDCAVELVSWLMSTKHFNVPNARIRSIVTTSLKSFFAFYDSTADVPERDVVAPSAESLVRVLRGILTERLSAFMPADSYGLAARLLYMYGDISSLRILLRDSLSLPTFQPPTSTFFAARDTGDSKNGRVSLFVNVIGFILHKRSSAPTVDLDSGADLVEQQTAQIADDASTEQKGALISESVDADSEDAQYPDVRDIDLILELFKDLCAAGHTRRVVDLLAKVISFYLRDVGATPTQKVIDIQSTVSAIPSSQTPAQPEKPSNMFKSKPGTKTKWSPSAGTDTSKVVTIAAASDTERKLRRLERERDRARAIHHLLREGRRVVHSYPHPVPLPSALYKLLAQVYKDANLVEFLSEMFQYASEDNAVDRPLRDMVLSSISSGQS